MCGIAGLALRDTGYRPDRRLLARMCAALRHRGPDDAGGFISGGIGLSMRRLSVIDIEGGHQPIFNEDRSVAVVFNGEIYNFRELRKELQSKGHTFATASDTEVIAHLYEEHGLACIEHLHGMFAFALWDRTRARLLLARDRLGVKPLYYYEDGTRILFASEIKSILQDARVPRAAHLPAIDHLITFGHQMPPETCFSGIRELPPACYLTFERGSVSVVPYWDLHSAPRAEYDEQNATEELLRRLRGAVQRRLISDAPIGAFLSGGIDSSIVVAFMSHLTDERVKTFSIGFDDPSFSELPYARAVAKHCGTAHHEFVVKPRVADLVDKLIYHHDTPFYDTSAIPTYYLSELAREHVTVALSGDGGDELFAGYNIHLAHRAAAYYQIAPRWLRDYVIGPLINLVPETTSYINRGRVLREFARGAALDTLPRYVRWTTKIKRETRRQLYQHERLVRQLEQADEARLQQLFSGPGQASDLSRLLYLGTKTELPGDMLVKVDRMSMAHALEVRSPLLDHTLFEFAAGLPDRAKIHGWTSKYLLRKVAARLLPPEILRRPKRGFSVPLDRWLRENLAELVRDTLLDSRTASRGLFNQATVQQLVEQHMSGRVSRGRELWTLVTIERWHRMYIDELRCFVQEPETLPLSEMTLPTRGR